jgi:hypothetical protein
MPPLDDRMVGFITVAVIVIVTLGAIWLLS